MLSEDNSHRQMRSSTPTGTITKTAEAILEILEAETEGESFSREEAVAALTSKESFRSIDDERIELLEPLTEADYEMYLDVLISNGYLYGVDDQLRITP
jgi:hypothetical protein